MKFLSILTLLAVTTSLWAEHHDNLNRLKVLHISFHQGCINDFKEVGRKLNLDLTSWYIHDSPEHFEDRNAGGAMYNITADRAQRVWHKHKDYFNQFDAIVTSDTAPLSRIFLQNDWKKPLIIWVCNRFDYADGHQDGVYFPDGEYYRLFNQATQNPLVTVIPYTAYESVYARMKNITIQEPVIKPLGSYGLNELESKNVGYDERLFLYPRMESSQLAWIINQCAAHDLNVITGTYKGPDDLTKYKAVLYFPYQWSNLALFEDIQRGIIHCVPSREFIMQLYRSGAPIRHFDTEGLELCEWYDAENQSLFIYFDSWQDLRNKLQNIDLAAMRDRIKEQAKKIEAEMFARWRAVFDRYQ